MAAQSPDNMRPPLDYASARTASPADPGAEIVRWLFPAYIFLILIAFFALRIPGVKPAGNTLNHDRAVFTSVNAATLTGFQLSIHPREFSSGGKFIILALTVAGTLFSFIVGGLAVKRILRLAWPDSRIISAAIISEIFVLTMGAISGGFSIAGPLQTAAAFANSGIHVDTPPQPLSVFTFIVLLPLAVLGGLGITVLIELFDWLVHRKPLSTHAQTVLRVTSALFLIGVAGCALLQVLDLSSLGMKRDESWTNALGRLWPKVFTHSTITSINSRTYGFAALPVYTFPRALAFFVMLLMMVGASPGGTGGGLKTTTLYELLTAPARVMRGERLGRGFGIAATWLGIYLLAAVVFHLLLLWLEPQMPGDRLLFITLSALSNVGLSHDVVDMTRGSLLVVSAAMFFGRITPLLILWWMADTTRDADLAIG